MTDRGKEAAMREQWPSGERRSLAAAWEREAGANGIRRPYSPEDVLRLRNSFPIRHSLAERGAERLRRLLETEDYVLRSGR
jgi:isocitrate lyase